MKKYCILPILLLLLLQGCSTQTKAAPVGEASSTHVDEADIDLTVMTPTLVYSEVSNMLSNPDNFKGKTVKMTGPAASFTDEKTKKTYHACIIADATACCQQGIEYVLSSGDYKADGNEVTVTGVFDTYVEDGIVYCTLKNATYPS